MRKKLTQHGMTIVICDRKLNHSGRCAATTSTHTHTRNDGFVIAFVERSVQLLFCLSCCSRLYRRQLFKVVAMSHTHAQTSKEQNNMDEEFYFLYVKQIVISQDDCFHRLFSFVDPRHACARFAGQA